MTAPDTHISFPQAHPNGTTNSVAAALVALGILLSRISGIVREIVLSAWLGATTVAAEAFAFTLGIPKVMQNLLGEGALSASFIPVYSQVVDEDPRVARRLAGAVFGLLAALVGAVVLIMILAAEPIVAVVARGAGDQRTDLIVELLRTMAPGIGFIVFAAWCLGILNAHRDFFLSYVAPVLWNTAIIAAVLIWTTQTDDLASLARAASWGVFIGGVAQFAVQLPRVLRIAGPITPTLDRTGSAVREVMRRFVPGVAGRGVVTIGTLVDLLLASFLTTGAIAVLTKAQTLYLMPISVFAISIAAADLPELSREASSPSSAAARVRLAVDRVALFLVFSAIAFVFGGRSLVGALFERGQFTEDDTVAVWLALAVFSFGLLASGMSRVFQNASYAHGDVAGPAKIALLRLVVSAIVGLVLMLPADRFQVVDGLVERTADFAWSPLDQAERNVEGVRRLGAVGLAAGSAVGAWLEFGLLKLRLRSVAPDLGVWLTLRRLAVPGVLSGLIVAVLAAVTNGMHPLLAAPITLGPPGSLFVLVAARSGNLTAGGLVTGLGGLSGRRK